MKKYIMLLTTTLLIIGLFNEVNAQQLFGRWVVPTMVGTSSNASYQLTFTDAGIDYLQLPTAPVFGSVEYCYMSAGGYDENYDRQFYVVGETFCYGDNSFDWVDPPSGPAELKPEYQIIQKPNDTEKYYSFFTHLYNGVDHHFLYNEIYIEDNQVNITDDFFIRGGLHGYVAFAITPEDTSPRYLYVSTGSNSTSPPNNVAGIRKWTITSNGMEDKTIIVSQNTQGFDEYDFDAYNLELKIDDNGNTVIAFIHGTENTNPSYNQIVTEIIVVNDGDPQKFELGRGRIAGIEFSTFEPNMLYASCEGENGNGGIVKVNYTNGQIVETVFSGDFERTFLQTAPDGNIYGVSNNGHSLGRILQIGANAGTFEHEDVFTFPIAETVSTFRVFDGLKYYILPENSRTWIPLEAEAFPVDVSCPGYADGEVTIYPTGGVGPYTIEFTPPIPYTWDEDEGCFIATGLAEGTYYYIITDSYENTFDGEFIIDVDYSDYTYLEHHTFDESEIFDNVTYSFAEGFTVPEDVSITFNNSSILMGPNASIIIESGTVEDIENNIAGVNGAELILNSTTLTHHAACNEPWQGIQIWGITSQSQLVNSEGFMYQGKLVVENNSFIKNAWNAVTTQNPANFNSHGGIIIAKNSTFENNKRSVEIMKYENYNPFNSDIKLPYIHKFVKCTLVINNNYLIPTDMYSHVSMWDVYGINFRGCVFRNDNTAAEHTGYGIISLDAGYKVVDYTFGGNTQLCEFYNLYKGIHATNSISNNTIVVDSAYFKNNSIGIYISAVDNATVIKSRFEIGYNDIDGGNCNNCSSFGIDVHSALGYVIENNYFTKLQGAPPGNYVGVRLYFTQSVADDIYNNEFEGLSIGNLSEEYNRPDIFNDTWGVSYICNDNYDNNFDFYVADNSIIRGGMGTDVIPSGNTLSQNAEVQFQNDYTQDIRYYYYDSEQDEILTLYSDNVFPYAVSSSNPCPDHFSNGGGIGLNGTEKLQKVQDYNQNMGDYNNVVNLFETLKDDGDTPLMENEVETAWPDEMWDLRIDLLASSPHLSFEVLKDVADKTDVFPESVQFDIFAANPDEMRNNEFLLYLENKAQPFPEYMIDMLRQIGYGSSYKTVLLNQISVYYTTAIGAAQAIVRSELFDSITDYNEVRTWLGNISTYAADKQIISTYLQQDSVTLANNLLSSIPATHSLTGDQLLAYNDYSTLVQLHMNLINQGRTIMQLDSSEITTVVDIADNGMGSAVAQSRNILSMLYGNHYYDCPSLPENLELKRHSVLRDISNDVLFINAKPNPASTWVAFDYQLPFYAHEGIIKIIDITGKVLTIISVTNSIGQKTWDVRNIKSGVYLYILEAGGTTKSGKLIIR